MTILLNRIKYKFYKFGFYYYSVKYSYFNQDKKGLFVFIRLFADRLKIFNYRYGYYEYLEIPITTRCSLRCKNCSNLIPYYREPKDYDIDVLIKSIKTFLKCINNIVYIRILGGEPFLSKNLILVLSLLVKSDKVQRIEIVTNGSIVFNNKRLIRLLRNKRVVVCISKYDCVNSLKLVLFLKNNSIKYRVDSTKYWMDYGCPIERNVSEKELKKQFFRCGHICHSLVNGQVHLCPRSSHGTDLGILKDNYDDYVDLLDNSNSIEDKKRMLNNLFKKKYILACRYCIYGTNECRKIAVAEQIENIGGVFNEKK